MAEEKKVERSTEEIADALSFLVCGSCQIRGTCFKNNLNCAENWIEWLTTKGDK